MTRAEILNCLTDRPRDSCKFHESGKCERWECVFEEKPDDAEPCEDAINRKAVLNMQYRIDDSATLSTRDVVDVDDIEELPSVTPKQKMGRWLAKSFHEVYCDNCGFDFDIMTNEFIDKMKYCPNCGAKMVEPQESED